MNTELESTTRFRMKLGIAEIDYEGSAQFLRDEILPTVNKMLERVDTRIEQQGSDSTSQIGEDRGTNQSQGREGQEGGAPTSVSLASYLKAKGGQTKQVRRFLATAAWLSGRGTRELTSGLIAKTLQENQQSRLANPADCLNKNVAKGHCEKTKDGFFITPEGWAALESKDVSE